MISESETPDEKLQRLATVHSRLLERAPNIRGLADTVRHLEKEWQRDWDDMCAELAEIGAPQPVD